MINHDIILPSKPRIISETDSRGVYEIEGLYPGYGQTLGNSLRRIILSSLVGTAITSVKISGASHEFSTIEGVKEDAISIILNLKKVKFRMATDEPQVAKISVKGVKTITADDIDIGGQVEVVNKDQIIAMLTDKSARLEVEMHVEKGIGYMPKEMIQKDKSEIGTIWLDASFTPVRRVSYEVENMRVADRTDYNRLRIAVETDGSVSPKEALEKSIEIMIHQLKSIVGFKEDFVETSVKTEKMKEENNEEKEPVSPEKAKKEVDFLKTRIEDLGFSSRILKVMEEEGIRTAGGLARKREEDLSAMTGLGDKAIEEIKILLAKNSISLKS